MKHFLKLFDLHLKHEKKKKMEPVHLKELAKCFFLYCRATVVAHDECRVPFSCYVT